MKWVLVMLFLVGTIFADRFVGVCAERRSGGYIYSGTAKERIEPYLEKLHMLEMKIEDREKELKEIENEIRKKRVKLAMLETKIATIEKMKRRLYLQRDFDIYIVKEGDSLWKIAGKKEIYGDPFKWEMLYTANRDVIKNPHRIYPGQILIIPRVSE